MLYSESQDSKRQCKWKVQIENRKRSEAEPWEMPNLKGCVEEVAAKDIDKELLTR